MDSPDAMCLRRLQHFLASVATPENHVHHAFRQYFSE